MSLQACADLVARADPDRYLTVMASPVTARRILFAIYAFNVEVSRAPWVTAEPMIAEMRLQWWKDALEEIASGAPVRAHDVAQPLAAAITVDGAAQLITLTEARRWDIYTEGFESKCAFSQYLDATAGGLTWAAAKALGAEPKLEPICRDIAWAAGLAGMLSAAAALMARGRKPLLDDGDAAIIALCDEGLERLDDDQNRRRKVPKEVLPAILPAWQTRPLLKQARRNPARVREGRLGLSEARKKALLIWHARGLR
ncbi:MAG: squalene/phytoene synthase family protein [Pseudomonadota bacterium]